MRRLSFIALLAAGIVVFVLLSASGAEAPEDGHAGPTEPRCEPQDPVLMMDGIEAERGRGRHGSPEQAMRAEVTSIYPKLPPEAFRQNRSGSHSEFVHERNGRPVASATVEQVGRGWALETFHACNSVLVEARRGGRS